MSIAHSHPETAERQITTYPFDPVLRERLRELRAAGETSNAKLSKSTRLNEAVVSQYLNDGGNLYRGDTAKIERALTAWLDRREMESLAGIPTITTPITEQIIGAAKMIRRAKIMGKGIGPAGIGKTRGATLLSEEDETAILILVSDETGTRGEIRSMLFKKMGIRGPQKRTANRNKIMYAELVKRLRDSDILLIFDQAHMLTARAINFLVELWNATRSPQLWLGTGRLQKKLERDEQWASRLEFTFDLRVTVDEEINEVRDLVQHQIKSRIPDLNGEMHQLCKRCEKLALTGSFRRVEMRLATMLYLRESPRNKDKSWIELFDMSSEFLTN